MLKHYKNVLEYIHLFIFEATLFSGSFPTAYISWANIVHRDLELHFQHSPSLYSSKHLIHTCSLRFMPGLRVNQSIISISDCSRKAMVLRAVCGGALSWTHTKLPQKAGVVQGSNYPDSKVHGPIMGPTWILSAPDGPHVGPMDLLSGKSRKILCNGCDSWCHPGPAGHCSLQDGRLPTPLPRDEDCHHLALPLRPY